MTEELTGELAAVLAAGYDLPSPVTCAFFRHGFNEHFRVDSPAGEYHVRLYLDGKYYIGGDDDLAFELAFVDALAASGCPVARPVRRADGGLLTVGRLGGRDRRIAVFELARGDVERSPGATTVEALGAAVAEIHARADELALPGARYHLDERYLLHQPVDQLRRLAGDTPEIETAVRRAEQLAEVLAELPRVAVDYGPIHADLHLGNIHVTPDGAFTIFDFDHCAHGWRAYDLAPLRASLDDARWQQLLAGYRSRRPLPAGVDRIDELVHVRVLWDVGDVLAMQPAWGSTRPGEQIRARLPALVERLGGG